MTNDRGAGQTRSKGLRGIQVRHVGCHIRHPICETLHSSPPENQLVDEQTLFQFQK